MTQRALYEEQAVEIDRIQKKIFALAQKEETYDVFICYKETDFEGKRTQDSVIANDIYYQLTQEGFKVFYAAITLEGKLGNAYEPIIFAALNSAKVMLAIGTKPEYFNAVWVKNEWSRFLKIIRKDRSKLLIPCYRDMEAYELPEEFAHLQAQDMSKIGFINDIVRGIKKVVRKDENIPTTVRETVIKEISSSVASPAYGIEPLLKRMFMFLEDGEFARADEFCERVLNQDPECAEAYLGKLMVDLKVKTKEELKDSSKPFDGNNNYRKVIKYASEDLTYYLSDCIKYINERYEETEKVEKIRKEKTYSQAIELMKCNQNADAYMEAMSLFQSIKGYKDSQERINECLAFIEDQTKCEEDYLSAIDIMKNAKGPIAYTKAANKFGQIIGYKDAEKLSERCLRLAQESKEKEKRQTRKALFWTGFGMIIICIIYIIYILVIASETGCFS